LETIEQLERILGDRDLGPATRSAAARALGALGAARSVGPLATTLQEAAVRQASCEALGAMGEDAAPALPGLVAIIAEPSLAVRNERGIHYSIEAGRRLSDRIAAARAVARIAGDRGEELLCPYALDVDVGHVIRRELGRARCPLKPVGGGR
jgi:HEAT repeat protein